MDINDTPDKALFINFLFSFADSQMKRVCFEKRLFPVCVQNNSTYSYNVVDIHCENSSCETQV